MSAFQYDFILILRRVVLKKEVRERTQKIRHFQQHFKLFVESVSEALTFNTLQTKACVEASLRAIALDQRKLPVTFVPLGMLLLARRI